MKRIARIVLWFKVTLRRKMRHEKAEIQFALAANVWLLVLFDLNKCAPEDQNEHLMYVDFWEEVSIKEAALNRERHLQ